MARVEGDMQVASILTGTETFRGSSCLERQTGSALQESSSGRQIMCGGALAGIRDGTVLTTQSSDLRCRASLALPPDVEDGTHCCAQMSDVEDGSHYC